MEESSVSNGNTGEPEVTMATTDGTNVNETSAAKSAFSPTRPTAVVNRLKSILATMKKTTTERTKESNVSMETNRASTSPMSNDSTVPESGISERPKVPLKQRSFLNPFLELTAAAQGTTEEEVIRKSPDLFENVIVKKEKPDYHSDQCSQSSSHSEVSDKGANVLSKVPSPSAIGDPWSDMMSSRSLNTPPNVTVDEGLPAQQEGCSKEPTVDVSSDVDKISVPAAISPGNPCSETLSDRSKLNTPQNVPQLPAEIRAQREGSCSQESSNVEKTSLPAVTSPAEPRSELLSGRSSVISATAEQTELEGTADSLDKHNDLNERTEEISSQSEGNSIPLRRFLSVVIDAELNNSEGTDSDKTTKIMEDKGCASDTVVRSVVTGPAPTLSCALRNYNCRSPSFLASGTSQSSPVAQQSTIETAAKHSESRSETDIAEQPKASVDTPKSSVEAFDMEATEGSSGGIEQNPDTVITDEADELGEDALKHLKEKFPLLWEAAAGEEADEDTRKEQSGKSDMEVCGITAMTEGHSSGITSMDITHEDFTKLKENAIVLAESIASDVALEQRASSPLEEAKEIAQVPTDKHGGSDCSNEKISKISISDESDMMLIDEDIYRPLSTSGSGRSTGTGGNVIADHQSSSDLVSNEAISPPPHIGLYSGDVLKPLAAHGNHSAQGSFPVNSGCSISKPLPIGDVELDNNVLLDSKGMGDSSNENSNPIDISKISKIPQKAVTMNEKATEAGHLHDTNSTGEDQGIPPNINITEPHKNEDNPFSDFMSIKIADVKSMNVEDFESVIASSTDTDQNINPEGRSCQGSPTPRLGTVVTVYGASGPTDNIKTKDVIVSCKYQSGKYHCLLCKFSISFSSAFALHLHRHLHLLAQVCTVCFTPGSSSRSVNDSPFNLTCPVVKSTIDRLESLRQEGYPLQQNLTRVIEQSFPAVSPLSLSSFTPTENILEPNFPGSDMTVLKRGTAAHVGSQGVRQSTESEEDCVIIAGIGGEMGGTTIEHDSAIHVKSEPHETGSVDSTPKVGKDSNKKPVTEPIGPIPTNLPMSQFQRSMSSPLTTWSSPGNPLTAHQLTEELLVTSIMKLENSKGFYTCGFPKCNFSTSIESNLETHNIVSHSFERSFPCVYCGHTFDEGDSLLIHMKGHHNASKMFQLYRCCFQRCKFCSNNSNAFKQHFEIMHAIETKFSCAFCKEEMNSDDELISHLNKNLLKLTQCPYCLVRSPRRPLVLQHIKRQHPNEVRRVTVTSKTICSDMKKVLPPASDQIHVCSACQYKTSQAGRFRKHLVNCEKAKNFHAMMASSSESPSQASSLGDTEYVLQRQGSFSERSTKSEYVDPTQVDMNAGNGSEAELDAEPYPIFVCSACKVTYKTNSELTRHIKEHHHRPLQHSPSSKQVRTPSPSPSPSRDLKKHLCDKCGLAFNDRVALHRHRTDLHGIDSDSVTDYVEETDNLVLRCPVCSSFTTKYRTMSAFKRHMLKHPGKHVILGKMCRACMFMGPTKEVILLHYSERHSEVTIPEVDSTKLIYYGEKAKCPVCDIVLGFNVESIITHMMKHHPGNHSALKQALEQLPDDNETPVEVGRKLDDKFICEYCDEKFTNLSPYLKHIRGHFSGEKHYTFFKCACCHYQTDRKGLVSRHVKSKHTGVTSPPDYIRYVTLTGTLGVTESSHWEDDTDSSHHKRRDSPASFDDDEDHVMESASDLYENPSFEPQDEADYIDMPARNIQSGYDAFLTPAIPDDPRQSFVNTEMPAHFIKTEPEEVEQTALAIERFHCDYCTFSSDIMEEFENHRCDPNAALEIPEVRDMQQGTPATEEYEASSSSEGNEEEDFETSTVTSRKVGNGEWECTECGYRSQHRNKIQRHYRYRHYSKKPYICGYCNFSAVESGHVRRHCRNIHPGRPVSVVNTLKAEQDELYQESQDDANLPSDLEDQISQVGPYIFQCNICQYTSETHHLIERHVLCVHFKFHKYECKFCNFTSAEKGKMIKHCKQSHKGNIGFTMRKYDKSKMQGETSAALGCPEEEQSDTTGEIFTTPSPGSLKRKLPMKPVSNQKKAKIEEHDEASVLAALTQFYSDIRANICQEGEEERFYCCTACNYTNTEKWCVVRHVSQKHPESNDFDLVRESHRRSDQKKNFSCKICGKSAPQHYDIKKHVLSVHFNVAVYNCKYCPTRLHSKMKMSTHVRTLHRKESQVMIEYPDPLAKIHKKMDKFCTPKKHEDGKYRCLFCPFLRTSSREVEKHLLKVHLNYLNPFKCVHCGYSARSKDAVRAHHGKWHKGEYLTVIIVQAPDLQNSKRDTRLSSESSSVSEATPLFNTNKRKRRISESSSISSNQTPTPKKLMKYVPGREAEQLLEEGSQQKMQVMKASPSKKKVSPLKVKIGPNFNSVTSGSMIDLHCQVCGKLLSNEGRLKTHLMMHLDYRPYRCSQTNCKARFIEKSGVDKHSRLIHFKPTKYRYVDDEGLKNKLSTLMKGEVPNEMEEKSGVKDKLDLAPKVEIEAKIKLEPDTASAQSGLEEEVGDGRRRNQVHFVTGKLGSPIPSRHRGKTIYTCPHCSDYRNSKRSNCVKHIGKHGPKTYKCCYCHYLGHWASNVKEHWAYHHKKSRKPFVFIKIKPNTEKLNEGNQSSIGDSESESPKRKAKSVEHTSTKGEKAILPTPQNVGNKSIRHRNFALIKGPLGEPREATRNRRTIYGCPHCDHKTESKHNCFRHIKLHGPKIFKCKDCEFIGAMIPEVTKHCLRIHGRNSVVRLSEEQAIAMEEGLGAALNLQGQEVKKVWPEPAEAPKRNDPNNQANTKVAWIVQKLGWPRAGKIKNNKFGLQQKWWKCPFCEFSMQTKIKVVYHMETHMEEKFSEATKPQLPEVVRDEELYAEVIMKLGKPRVVRRGETFSKNWRCTKCPFVRKTKRHVLKHMELHLEQAQDALSNCEEREVAKPSTSRPKDEPPNRKVDTSNIMECIRKVKKRNGEIKYECKHCEYQSDIRNNAILHAKRHGEKRFQCCYCDFKGYFSSEVTRHGKRHPGKPPKYLKIGGATSSIDVSKDETVSGKAVEALKPPSSETKTDKKLVRTNMQHEECPVNKVIEDGQEIYNCTKCSYSANNLPYYRKHYKRMHVGIETSGVTQGVTFECDRCKPKVAFDTLNEVKRHHYHKHRGKKFRYKLSAADGEPAKKRCDIPIPPMPERGAQGMYHCSKCTFKAEEKASFLTHWRAHRRGFTCTICGYLQLYPSHIERHIKSVHKEMDHEKFVVDNAKDALQNLEGGDAKETAVKKPTIDPNRQGVYKCSKCIHTSYSELDHALHYSLHISPKKEPTNSRTIKPGWTGWSPRPWECGYCSKGFFAYSKAKLHWSTFHSDLPMKIEQCDERTGHKMPQKTSSSDSGLSGLNDNERTESETPQSSLGSPDLAEDKDASGSSLLIKSEIESDDNENGENKDTDADAEMEYSNEEQNQDKGRQEQSSTAININNEATAAIGEDCVNSAEKMAADGLSNVKEENLWDWSEADTSKDEGVGCEKGDGDSKEMDVGEGGSMIDNCGEEEDFEGGWTIVSEADNVHGDKSKENSGLSGVPDKAQQNSESNKNCKPNMANIENNEDSVDDVKRVLDTDCAVSEDQVTCGEEKDSSDGVLDDRMDDDQESRCHSGASTGLDSPGDSSWMVLDEVTNDDIPQDVIDDVL